MKEPVCDCETVGLRVAVISADRSKFLGYGVFEGDFVHPYDGEPFTNPRMILDSGERVWGCECWWGPASEFDANGYAAKYGVEPRSAA